MHSSRARQDSVRLHLLQFTPELLEGNWSSGETSLFKFVLRDLKLEGCGHVSNRFSPLPSFSGNWQILVMTRLAISTLVGILNSATENSALYF